MEKQQKKVRKTKWKLASKEGSSNQGSTSFSKGVLAAKPPVIKAI